MTTQTPIEDQKAAWLKQNFGAIERVRAEAELSYHFVREVFWGREKSGSRRIERMFHELGAPGFEQFAQVQQ